MALSSCSMCIIEEIERIKGAGQLSRQQIVVSQASKSHGWNDRTSVGTSRVTTSSATDFFNRRPCRGASAKRHMVAFLSKISLVRNFF